MPPKQKFKLDCDCGFSVVSHDRNEVSQVATGHVGRAHKEVKLNPKDIEVKIKTI